MAKTRRGTTLLSAVMAILMVFSIGFAPAAMPAAAYAEEAKSAAIGDTKRAETKEDQKAPEANGSKVPAKEDAKTEEHGDKNDGTDEAARSAKDKSDENEAPAGPIEAVGEFFEGVADGIKQAAAVVVEAVTGTFNMAVKGIKAMLGAEDVPGNGLKPAFRFVWDDNGNSQGTRPSSLSTSPFNVNVYFFDEAHNLNAPSQPITVDFGGLDETTNYFGSDEMAFPRFGATYDFGLGNDLVGYYDFSLPAEVDSALTDAGYSLTLDSWAEDNGYYVGTVLIGNGSGGGSSGSSSETPTAIVDAAGLKPKVEVDLRFFDGLGYTPSLNTFHIVAYDSNGGEDQTHSVYVDPSTEGTFDNYWWTYEAATLPSVGSEGVSRYEIQDMGLSDSSYQLQYNGNAEDGAYSKHMYSAIENSGGGTYVAPVPQIRITWLGGDDSSRTNIGNATVYALDSSYERVQPGTSASLSGSGDYWEIDLGELAPVDYIDVYGYEVEMPQIADYDVQYNGGYDDGSGHYVIGYQCSYNPSPSGLKPALKIVWNDGENPNASTDRASIGTGYVTAYDGAGIAIANSEQAFTPSGSGDMWTITFDDLPAYGAEFNGSGEYVADSSSGYQYNLSAPAGYTVSEGVPSVDSTYYYKTYDLTCRPRPNPSIQIRNSGSSSPSSVSVTLYDGDELLETYTMTDADQNFSWNESGDDWDGDLTSWEHAFSYPAVRNGAVANYRFEASVDEPYWCYVSGWMDSGDTHICTCDVNYTEPSPATPRSNPWIHVWWWDEWWTHTQPEYLSVTLYDNGVPQETKQIFPDYHGMSQENYHGDWTTQFTEYPDEAEGHSYSFSIAFPDGYSVPGYDLTPVETVPWTAQDGYFTDQWSIFLVPNTTPYTLTRTDSTSDYSGDAVDLEIVTTLPSTVASGHENELAPALPASYTMTTPTGTVTPTAESTSPITLTYSATVSDGQSLSLNLIKGSNVSIRKTGSSPSIAKVSGAGTDDGSSITFGVGETALEPTVIGAYGSGDTPTPSVTTEGTITISQNAMNADTTYDAYRVFQGPVSTEGGQDKASSLAWDANAPQTEVLAFLDQNGYADWLTGAGHANASLRANPMLAAQFISEKIADTTASPTAVAASGDQPRTTTADSFASGLARVLVQYGTSQANDATAGVAYQNEQGYYLFVTDTNTIGNSNEAGTAPIWAPITDTARVIAEKTEIPTLTSQVTDDDNATPGKAADGNFGQDLTHTLTATLPANIKAYPAYAMTIVESLPSGMTLANGNTSHVSVTLGGQDVTGLCSVSYENDTLTVTAANVLDTASTGVEVTPDTTLVVSYQSHLDNDAVVGPEGNMTRAQLTYTADPNSSDPTSQTPTQDTYTYANEVSLEKIDRETRLALDGVAFTIQDSASGMYVAADGTLSGTPVNHTTASGTIDVRGVDSGTYTITEVSTASGYKLLSSPITLAITPTYDAAGNLADFVVSATGENFAAIVAPAITVGANEDGVSIVDASLMKAGLRVSNLREIVLPLTGMPLGMGIAVYGSILLAISLAVYVRNKRIKDQIAELEDMEG